MVGDPTYADAIMDRLVNNAYRFELNGETMRPKLGRHAEHGAAGDQGCSTLQMNHLRQRLEAAKSGAISILTECACSIGLEDIEPEAAESGEHARVAPYT
jgi:F0F1-type ATP synthase beta subunit